MWRLSLIGLLMLCLVPNTVFASDYHDATGLWAEYRQNGIAFEQKYKGREIILVGEVREVGRSIMGNKLEVTLKAGGLYTVVCEFPDHYAKHLAKIKVGNKYKFRGTYRSKAVATLFFENCGGTEK